MRVLVVEDIPRHANRIAEGLRDQGIAVDVAYDGQQAISKVNVNPFTNTVKVTIARLRRKLGRPDIIHTTPGVGYRIIEAP